MLISNSKNEVKMRIIILALAGLLLCFMLTSTACNGDPNSPDDGGTKNPDGETLASSCVTCHTDKTSIQQTASTDVSEKPEEASGEG